MRRIPALILALAMVAPAAALAKAPEPKKPVEIDRFMGRWYEILYTPSSVQKDCVGAHQVWSQDGPKKFNIVLTCVKEDAGDKDKVVKMSATVTDPGNTKFEASFFGGLVKQRYWVLDHGDDYGWMIASTAGGGFAALLSRRPTMAAGEVSTHKASMAAMGLETGKLVATKNTP